MSSQPPPYSTYPQPQGPPPPGFVDPKYTTPYPQQAYPQQPTTIYVHQPPQQQVIYQQGYARTPATTVYVMDNGASQRAHAQHQREEAQECACWACLWTVLCCCLLN